jgi:hypothetical protein
MFTARKKIVKEKGVEPDAFEESVAQVRCSSKADIIPAAPELEATGARGYVNCII